MGCGRRHLVGSDPDLGDRMTDDREELWLSLLRTLTERFPRWAVWKNMESALHGVGDLDALAPLEDWAGIQFAFVEMAKREGLGPVLVCRHMVPGQGSGRAAGSQLHLLTLEPGSPYVIQLDVKEQVTFRGSPFFDSRALEGLSAIDDHGVRTIRPGAEGLVKMCLAGTRRGGLPDTGALERKRVRELLVSDPEGVELAAAGMGSLRPAVLRAAEAVVDGGWDRRSMMTVEAWSMARSVTVPGAILGRAWYRRVAKPHCAVLQGIPPDDRRIEGDAVAWMRSHARDHDVIETAP
jgi:hypothetical protein